MRFGIIKNLLVESKRNSNIRTNVMDIVTQNPFDKIRHLDEQGNEYWLARELQPLLGYDEWRNFTSVIDRARVALRNQNQNVEMLIVGVNNPITDKHGRTQNKQDFKLTRFACYIIAQNGDPRKIEIAAAQAYFAIKTHEREQLEVNPLALAEQMLLALKDQDTRIKQLEDKLDNTPITVDGVKEGRLHNLLKSYGKRIGSYRQGYNRFYKLYNLGSYKQLPLRLYDEAVEIVTGWHKELDDHQNRLNYY